MTFEAPMDRDRVEVAPETEGMVGSTRNALPPRWNNTAADEMLGFVDQSAIVADRMRGLAQLFRGTFLPDHGQGPRGYEAAAEIIADCIEMMARGLDDNLTHAHARRDHLAAGGAR